METKPFGELSRSEQVALFEAWLNEVPIECRSKFFGNQWASISHPSWVNDFCYRIAAIPDSINWDHVHPKFKYMVRDENGMAYLHALKPFRHRYYWDSSGTRTPADSFTSYKKGGVNWADSLVERPS